MRKLPLLPKDDLYDAIYPASWYAVAESRKVRRRPMSADAFGERLVVWRDDDGAAHVQQRFCPHMGASLACGTVEGKHLVCPFHRWEFDAKGTCTHVPYVEDAKIPKRARLETFPVVEQNGFIWAFNGETPTHALPPLAEDGARGFSTRTKTQRFHTHPLLMLENACDAQHFKVIHKVDFERYEIENTVVEPHRFAFDVRQTVKKRSGKRFDIVTGFEYVGASLIYVRLYWGSWLLATLISHPMPVAPNVSDLSLIVAIQNLPWYLAPFNPLFRWILAYKIFQGAVDDYEPVWRDMDPSYRGALVAEDALQQRFRRYYRAHLPERDEPLAEAAE